METNTELDLAWRCVVKTATNLFLTGKAGTGKTTFLQQLKQHAPKRMIVLAPTGIAAINAGGVTIHSFFQLPFAPYIPGTEFAQDSKHQFTKQKINIIRSLELLVIDEISMVRADLLDSIDMMLRRYKKTTLPFGGIQLLLIGDLHQLPPVVKEAEKDLLGQYYDGIYFFNSKALQKTNYLTIELKQVYRQTEQHFLFLLNAIRNNTANKDVLNEINKRYMPNFSPNEDENYIRLTTHNKQANDINRLFLNKLTTPEYSFEATVKGNFPESSFPTEQVLTIKEGAQILFLKNDTNYPKRYYNGKIGKVISITDNEIQVQGDGDDVHFVLEKAVWSNAKYVLNKQNNEIEEEIEGTFVQYPIRLAWAITIHKSQGLTFDKAIIDAAYSFAHGQTYVALSRCRTLNGLILEKPISHRAIIKDDEIHQFVQQSELDAPSIDDIVSLEKAYYVKLVIEMFTFKSLFETIEKLIKLFNKSTLHTMYPAIFHGLLGLKVISQENIVNVSERFYSSLYSLFRMADSYDEDSNLQTRIQQAASYFADKLSTHFLAIIDELDLDCDNTETKQHLAELVAQLKVQIRVHIACLETCKGEQFTIHTYQKTKLEAFIENESNDKKKSDKKPNRQKLSDEISNTLLYNNMRAWRKNEADERNVPPFAILHQKALLGIVNQMPRNKKELLAVPHVGKRTVEKFGDTILSIVLDSVQ